MSRENMKLDFNVTLNFGQNLKITTLPNSDILISCENGDMCRLQKIEGSEDLYKVAVSLNINDI